jgi:RNA polymerase sigma-70 factor (ECF subfamily)
MGRPSGFATDAGVERGVADVETSASLLCRVQTFDPTAWARLIDLYGPLVYRWCVRARLQPADAADVGQDVFAAVARTITRFRREREGDSFRGWLYTITRNKIRDLVTARHRTAVGGREGLCDLQQVAAPPDDDGADDDASGTDRGYLVRRAVELVQRDFEPGTWAAFWRSVVDGQPADEVAAALGMTRNAVYLAKARVRKRLAEEFAGLIEFVEPAGDAGAARADGGTR